MSSKALIVKKVRTTKKSSPARSASALPRATPRAAATHHGHTHKAVRTTKKIEAPAREPLGHLLVEHALRDAGFKGEVSSKPEVLERYATDESIFHIKPQIVLRPKDHKDIEIAVRTLKEETKRFPSLSLTPRAAGTGLGGGSLTDSAVIDVCAHLDSIGEIKVSGQKATFTCEPGAMWKDVEKKLKTKGFYLPSYPASRQICSIGGAVANNAAGPDSLRFGHTADWVEALEVVLHDGETYEIKPLSYKEFKKLTKGKDTLAEIAREVFSLIDENEALIHKSKPKTTKNTAGYPLWNVIDTSVAEFKKGNGSFNLTRLFSGSQGTIGIITKITMRAEPITRHTSLIAVPVFDLASAGKVVLEAIKYDPINVEVFDSLTYDAAMKNPQFFRSRLSSIDYYRVLLSMYTTFHVRWRRKLPEFVLLITLDDEVLKEATKEAPAVGVADIVKALQTRGAAGARVITNPYEKEMFWQVRDASYLLSKLLDPNKRPAAFLEDMTVPPEHLAKFFSDIKYLLKRYNVTAAVHGHGGNAHFHFYPLLDFTNRTTPALVMKMANEFFATAVKYGGNICGEHNDGIIRTPYLHLMFGKPTLELFKRVEHIFDPNDIFNPGKKVNPRFDIKSSIRKTN